MKIKTNRARTILLCCGCIALALSTLLSLSSCAISVSATELSEGYTRRATATGEVNDAFTSALADFSFTLFRGIIASEVDSTAISPLSAALCLAMLANGTAGNTRAQTEAAFGMSVDKLNEGLYAYTSSLYSSGDCKVNIADSIWFRDEANRLHVNESFLQANADWFDAQIYAAPFDDTTLADINTWCRKYTDGMIEKMIDEIDYDTVMYLVNALTFDAKWNVKYEKDDIYDAPFNNYDGSRPSVIYMSSEESVVISGDSWYGFAKAYAGDKYSFVGLLPGTCPDPFQDGTDNGNDVETDIYRAIAELDGKDWLSLWQSRTAGGSATVNIPEFSASASFRLNDTLMDMGMKDMFGPAADFSALGYSEAGRLVCSSVDQKVFIQVDRNGTKAAAITWAAVSDESCAIGLTITLDRPFVYAVVDNETGLPLFVGTVTHLG